MRRTTIYFEPEQLSDFVVLFTVGDPVTPRSKIGCVTAFATLSKL